MAEARRLCAQRFEELRLGAGLGDMVGAADDMGDAEIDVIRRSESVG
jgi:hypothetical protein